MNSSIDLHCHTTASDGALSPMSLLHRAVERGVKTLAITDHDTLAGYRQVTELANEQGVKLITGIELSTVWNGINIHIVGLDYDPNSDIILQAEQAQLKARDERAARIAEKVGKKLGQELDLDQVKKYAGDGALGRPHFAQYMLDQGWVSDMATAFKKYLGAGKVGDVKTGWPDMAEAVSWINDAGGVAVMAHPHHYKMTRTKLKKCLVEFKETGGQAMEVACGLMNPNERGQMTALAKELGLMGSCGSDFHGPNRFGLDLGVMPKFPKDLTPVWSSFSSAIEIDAAT